MENNFPETHSDQIKSPAFSKTDLGNIAFIVMLCGILSYLRWAKMDTLVLGDAPRWLFEAQRVAVGQLPYRDFSWQYPPFSVLLLGWTMRFFGITFTVAQVFVDVVSISVVLAAYFLIRLLLPTFLLIPVMFCFIAVCGTSLMFFNLFSLLTYVPALQTAAGGFLWLLVGVLIYLRTGKLTGANWIMITSGAFIAAYSKPETFVATYSTLVVLAIADRNYWFEGRETREWFWHYTKLGTACAAPALIAYLWTGAVVGFANLREGITGYGLAGAACPWWPTGLGLFGAASSLGEAGFIAATLSLTRRKHFVARFGRGYYFGLAGGLLGVFVFLAYVFFNNWELLTGRRSIVDKIWYSGQSTFWTSAILLPVMWSSVVLWFYLAVRFIRSRRQRPSTDAITILVLLAGTVAMSARGWFNWSLGIRTDVPGVCYPFFLVLGPYLLWCLLSLGGPGLDLNAGMRAKAGFAVAALLVTYGLMRFIAGYPNLLSNRAYHELSTIAGRVRLINYETDSEIYRFVLENTSPNDTVLDLPYGGGINFATHRLSPFFDTQFRHVSMSDRFLDKDLDGIHQHPPRVVIADNQPNYGATYGLKDNVCPFPQLVWAPDSRSVADKIFPTIVYIQQNYRVAKVVGRKLLLVPK